MCSSVGNCSSVSCCNHLPVNACSSSSHVVRSRSSCTIHSLSRDEMYKLGHCYLNNSSGKNYDKVNCLANGNCTSCKCPSGQVSNNSSAVGNTGVVTSVKVPTNGDTCGESDSCGTTSSSQVLEGSFVTSSNHGQADHMSSTAMSRTNNSTNSGPSVTSSSSSTTAAAASTVVTVGNSSGTCNHCTSYNNNNSQNSLQNCNNVHSCSLRRFSSDESIPSDSGCGSSKLIYFIFNLMCYFLVCCVDFSFFSYSM